MSLQLTDVTLTYSGLVTDVTTSDRHHTHPPSSGDRHHYSRQMLHSPVWAWWQTSLTCSGLVTDVTTADRRHVDLPACGNRCITPKSSPTADMWCFLIRWPSENSNFGGFLSSGNSIQTRGLYASSETMLANSREIVVLFSRMMISSTMTVHRNRPALTDVSV